MRDIGTRDVTARYHYILSIFARACAVHRAFVSVFFTKSAIFIFCVITRTCAILVAQVAENRRLSLRFLWVDFAVNFKFVIISDTCNFGM